MFPRWVRNTLPLPPPLPRQRRFLEIFHHLSALFRLWEFSTPFFSFLSRRQTDFPNAVAQQAISTGQPPNDPNAQRSSGAVLGGEEHRRRVEQRGEPKKEAEPITMTEETQYTPKTVKDVDAHEFVRQYAKHLKGKVSDRTIHDEGSGTGRGCTERARAVLPLAVAGASIGAFRSPCALALAPSPLASARPCRDRRPRERKERLSDKKINSFLSLSLSLSAAYSMRER